MEGGGGRRVGREGRRGTARPTSDTLGSVAAAFIAVPERHRCVRARRCVQGRVRPASRNGRLPPHARRPRRGGVRDCRTAPSTRGCVRSGTLPLLPLLQGQRRGGGRRRRHSGLVRPCHPCGVERAPPPCVPQPRPRLRVRNTKAAGGGAGRGSSGVDTSRPHRWRGALGADKWRASPPAAEARVAGGCAAAVWGVRADHGRPTPADRLRVCGGRHDASSLSSRGASAATQRTTNREIPRDR